MASDDQIDPHEHTVPHRMPMYIRIIVAAMLLFIAATGLAPGITAFILP
jgi:hypothetical protein